MKKTLTNLAIVAVIVTASFGVAANPAYAGQFKQGPFEDWADLCYWLFHVMPYYY